MSDFILDDAARNLTIGDLLDRLGDGGLRLITPAEASYGELSPPREPNVFGDMNAGRSPQPRGMGISGDELRARLAKIDDAGLKPMPGLRPEPHA